jgi:hypothetical protein
MSTKHKPKYKRVAQLKTAADFKAHIQLRNIVITLVSWCLCGEKNLTCHQGTKTQSLIVLLT